MDTTYPDSRDVAIALGLNRYHGSPCAKCNTTLKRVKQYDCYTCQRASVRDYLKRQRKTPKGAAYRKMKRLEYKQRLVTQRPPWANLKAIRSFYLEASRRGLEVDHVIPLKGELVSGLHVETNLQLLTAEENSKKRNSFPLGD